MKPFIASAILALALTAVAPAFAQEAPPPPAAGEYAPPAEPEVAGQGEWVDTVTYGPVYVPVTSQAVVVSGRPYSYFYTPSYGWTWYVSPWGAGRYHRGEWVHARFEPHVYHGGHWVAPRHFAAPAHRVAVAPPAHRGGYHRR